MNFGDSLLNCYRRRLGKSFRKSLGVYSYKLGHHQYHKQPGVIPLNVKEKLSKDKSMQARNRLKELERNSPYPYGKFIGTRFYFDERRVPFFNVPDLTGFTLKPYVSVHTPSVEKKELENLQKLNDYSVKENFGRFIEENSIEKVKRLQLTGKIETAKTKKEGKAAADSAEVKQEN